MGEKMGVDKKYGCWAAKSVSVRKPQRSYTLWNYLFPEWVIKYKDIRHRLTPPSKAEDGGIMFKLYERHQNISNLVTLIIMIQ